MMAENHPTFSTIRGLLIQYRFHQKIAVLAARVHLNIDSEDQAWKCLASDQKYHFLEALHFLRESNIEI